MCPDARGHFFQACLLVQGRDGCESDPGIPGVGRERGKLVPFLEVPAGPSPDSPPPPAPLPLTPTLEAIPPPLAPAAARVWR